MSKLTSNDKIKKYYDEHPYVETYKGWVIRKYSWETKYLGTSTVFTCDVYVGGESCWATQIEMVRNWIDEKIKECKVQKEDIDLL